MTNQPAPGTKVKILAGSEIFSTGPGKGISKRTRTVTVHSTDMGVRYCVGYVWSGGVFHPSHADLMHYLRYHQVCLNQDALDLADLIACANSIADLREIMIADSRVVICGGAVFITVKPPMVHWVGSGGYWCWTAISNISA